MVSLRLKTATDVQVKFLQAECGVRCWEDAKINGVKDEDGTLIPMRKGDDWCPLIDIETGVIEGWPKGTVADINYKVCDNGRYSLLDADKNEVKSIDGYVPKIMSPNYDGFGDYVFMEIDGDGKIGDWWIVLSEFEESD